MFLTGCLHQGHRGRHVVALGCWVSPRKQAQQSASRPGRPNCDITHTVRTLKEAGGCQCQTAYTSLRHQRVYTYQAVFRLASLTKDYVRRKQSSKPAALPIWSGLTKLWLMIALHKAIDCLQCVMLLVAWWEQVYCKDEMVSLAICPKSASSSMTQQV